MDFSSGHKTDWKELFLAGWRPYAWIILIGFVLYAKTLFFNFTYLDDRELILDNYGFLQHLSNIISAFKQSVYLKNNVVPYYRPVLISSFILDAQVGGLNPFIYHFTNVVIHLVSSSLLFFLLVKLGRRIWMSFFFAVIFVTHPMLAQAVAWIPGRNDSLAALFAILAFIFFIDFLGKKDARSYFLHMLFLAVGIFTKESNIILIFLFGLYFVFIRREKPLSFSARILAAGYVFVTIVWFILRQNALRDAVQINSYEAVQFILIQLPAIAQLIGKAIFPVNLSVLPTIWETTSLYGWIAIILLAAIFGLSKPKRPGFVLFGFAWMLLFLLPPMLRPHAAIVGDVLEHRFYMPMIGLIFMLTEIDYAKIFFNKKAVPIIGTAVILIFFAIAAVHIDSFRNKITFWENAVKGSPHSSFTRLLLGTMYNMDGRTDDAEREVRKAMKTDPLNGHYYLGSIYMKKGLLKEAEMEFRKHIALYPHNDASYIALGVLYYNRGGLKEAEGLWKRALELNPDNVAALKDLAIYYGTQKDYEKAKYYIGELQKRGVRPPPDFVKVINAAK